MKRVFKSIAMIATMVCVAYATFVLVAVGVPWRVNASFATKALLRYHHGGKAIDIEITNPNDLDALRKILSGWVLPDSELACGFDTDISITMIGGKKKIVFCPAGDTSSVFRIGNTNKYHWVSEARMDRFHEIVSKYGMIFPCL